MKNIFNKRNLYTLLGILLCFISFAMDAPEGVIAAGGAYLPFRGLYRNREIIKRLNVFYNANNNATAALTFQDSYLRFDQALQNNSTQYKFDFRQTVNNTNIPAVPASNLLAQGDAFFATYLQIQVGIVDTTAQYEALFNGYITYDNQAIFSAANLPGLTVGDLETLYDTGIITFHMGNTDFLDKAIPVRKCKVVPTTAGNGTTTQDSLNHQTDGCVDLPSIACMSGKMENWWLINTQNKNGIAWQSDADEDNKLFVSFSVFGVLVKGGSDDKLYPNLVQQITQVD